MITINREDGTDYLYAGFLEKALKDVQSELNCTIFLEPKRGDIYFSQDYFISKKDFPFQFVFYALPSLKLLHEEEHGEHCALVTYAADPVFHKPIETEKIYDVGFIGRPYYHERNQYLNAIEKFYPRGFLNRADIPGIEIPMYLSQCKVLFNHTRPEIDVNLRFFEEMALGAQVMKRTPSLSLFATEGEHYLGYDTIEEALEQINKLLQDEELRNTITKNAREHVLAHHTYKHRADRIVEELEKHFKKQ